MNTVQQAHPEKTNTVISTLKCSITSNFTRSSHRRRKLVWKAAVEKKTLQKAVSDAVFSDETYPFSIHSHPLPRHRSQRGHTSLAGSVLESHSGIKARVVAEADMLSALLEEVQSVAATMQASAPNAP